MERVMKIAAESGAARLSVSKNIAGDRIAMLLLRMETRNASARCLAASFDFRPTGPA